MALVQVITTITFVIIAWMISRLKYEVDDSMSTTHRTLSLMSNLVHHVIVFFYIMFLIILISIAMINLIKILILDFFRVDLPRNLIQEIFGMYISKRFYIFNAIYLLLFLTISAILISTTKQIPKDELNSNIQNSTTETYDFMHNGMVMFLITYVVCFVIMSLN